MKMFIGETIAKRRHEMNMTQEELATRLGVSGQAVSNWEREESYPDVTMLPALSVVLEVSVDELLGIGRETDEQIIENGKKICAIRKRERGQYCVITANIRNATA